MRQGRKIVFSLVIKLCKQFPIAPAILKFKLYIVCVKMYASFNINVLHHTLMYCMYCKDVSWVNISLDRLKVE